MNDNALLTDSRGAVAVMVAFSLVMLLGFAALVIDIGHALVTRNELQNVSDAAALAGARQLGLIYCPVPNDPDSCLSQQAQDNFVLDSTQQQQVRQAVIDVAALNYAAGTSIAIPTADIEIGTWTNATRTFTVTNATPHAVRVRARRDGTANLPITTFLAGLMGVQNIDVSAPATASLTGIPETTPGELDSPFGISDGNPCDLPIRFYPTNSNIGCSGWTTYTTSPSNANTLGDQIDGRIPDPPTYVSPGVAAGDSLMFSGGNVASALPNLLNLFNAKKVADPESPTGFSWNIFVPVYGSGGSCENPSGSMPIVGFASMKVIRVLAPPDGQQVDGILNCGQVMDGPGGGGDFGTVGSIPGLVQ